MFELFSANGQHVVTLRLWLVFKKKFLVIFLAGILAAVATYVGVKFFVTPKYEASTMLYVNNNSLNYSKEMGEKLTSSDINASRDLAGTVIVILKNSTVLDEVIQNTGVDYTYDQLLKCVHIEAEDNTEVLKVTVNTDSATKSARLANSIAEVLAKRNEEIIEGSSTKVVATARINEVPVSPKTTKDAAIGAIIVMLLLYALFVFLDTLHQTIETTDEFVQKYPDIPLLGEVPDLNGSNNKSNYYYGYGEKNKKAGKKR